MESIFTVSITSYHGIEKHVGNTPLIRLRRLSELTGCEILGKAEFMNPGGSVKDRAALGIITDAEAKGLVETRRYHRGRHGGQHRHRPRGDRSRERLSHGHRHSRNTVAGKNQHCCARSARKSSPCRKNLTAIPAITTASPSGSRRRKGGSGRTNLTTPPIGWGITAPPARKSGSRQRQNHRFRFRRRHRRHTGGHGIVFERAQSKDRHRLCRPVRRGHVVVVHQRQHRHEGR